MSRRGWYMVIGGAVMVVIGLFAMRFPVFISDFDQWGWQVKCGTEFMGDLRQAADATNGTHFVSNCESALLIRRLWAIPLVVIGSIAFIGMMLATALESLREAMPAQATATEACGVTAAQPSWQLHRSPVSDTTPGRRRQRPRLWALAQLPCSTCGMLLK